MRVYEKGTERGRGKEREKKRETGKEKKMRASKSLSCIFIAHLTLNTR